MAPHPRSDHHHAQVPPLDKIPEAARPTVEAFLKTRARRAEAQDTQRQAHAALKPAVEKDKAGLDRTRPRGGFRSAWQAQEARYAGEALGLTPRALVQLGWRIVDVDEEER
ncbi:hypothetical protein [Streptomyces sp. G45]|uniref:hypothetical protein n=1 Tax=Streptomyces sp. G45 TaxID=3406627 RepID=UPI003C1682AC